MFIISVNVIPPVQPMLPVANVRSNSFPNVAEQMLVYTLCYLF